MIRLKTEGAKEYIRINSKVWPDALFMISDCSITNYFT